MSTPSELNRHTQKRKKKDPKLSTTIKMYLILTEKFVRICHSGSVQWSKSKYTLSRGGGYAYSIEN